MSWLRARHPRAGAVWRLAGTMLAVIVAVLPETARPAQAESAGAAANRIILKVGPEILISRQGDVPHVETDVAVDPRNPDRMLAAAIAATNVRGGPACVVYSTEDGGGRWRSWVPDEQLLWGGVDPQVAFTPNGVGLLAALASEPVERAGRSVATLRVYRTEDGGASWSEGVDLGYSFDHPQIAIDHGTGPYAGSVYLNVLHGRDYRVGLFRSRDGGRTFVGPVDFAIGEDSGEGHNSLEPVVWRDGTLGLPYVYWERRNSGEPSARSGARIVVSQDGGVTFSPPTELPRIEPLPEEHRRLSTMPRLAVDRSSGPFDGRLYVVWADGRSGSPRIMLAVSDDRGATWSDPVPVNDQVPAGSIQYQPAVAVSPESGMLITWLDTRDTDSPTSSHLMAAGSADGGATFIGPRRISSQRSHRDGRGNAAFTVSNWRPPESDAARLTLLSFLGRWGHGGDYIGVTADPDGGFHPVWPDARSGTFHLWTARIELVEAGAAFITPELRPRDLTGDVELSSDRSRLDPTTMELVLPIRIRNTSTTPIYGPVIVEVVGFGSGPGTALREFAPMLLNPDRGEGGPGSEYVYDAALGDERSLGSGSVSSPVEWRLRLQALERVPDLHIRVRGFVSDTD